MRITMAVTTPFLGLIGGLKQRIFTLLLLVCIGISACGGGSQQPINSSEISSPWRAGIHYTNIASENVLPTPAGKVEVTEIFLYSCPACYIFEPQLVLWERMKPAYVEIIRVPRITNASDRAYARLYYALMALDRPDIHEAVYDAIHRAGRNLLGRTDEESFQLHLEFVKTYGVAPSEFRAVYHSSSVSENVARAERLMHAYMIDVTPSVVINGKWKTDMRSTGGSDYLMQITRELVGLSLRQPNQ